MLYHDRVDLSEGINATKNKNSKECITSRYWFFNHGFKFQGYVCHGSHYLTMLCNIAIINVKYVGDHCIVHNICNC